MAHARGFTLYELLIALAVLSIVLALGVPSFAQFIQNSRTTAQTNERIAALNLARSEALKRGDPVVVVPAGGDWTAEWQVGLDTNADGDLADDDDELLRVVPGVDPASLAALDKDGDPLAQIAFQGNGWATQEANLTLIAHDCAFSNQRLIRLNRAGLIAVSKQECP